MLQENQKIKEASPICSALSVRSSQKKYVHVPVPAPLVEMGSPVVISAQDWSKKIRKDGIINVP